ncbi:hypothetical protein [Falsibacillus albus]|uniref:Sporulation protein n=1 Tax=Falsibacillus albus TaxID=2478915 RepID=A0A3L7JRN1_9BACI|nr:hypothetical protein [Falsibacillus albus]RLQ93498.1 hypothetical protein D9X91_17510 [Falsibacillus albus]
MMKWIVAVIVMAGMLSGCGAKNESIYTHDQDNHGRQFVNNKVKHAWPDEEARQTDWTNQNPNFVGLSDTPPNMRTDVKKARQVIKGYTEYSPGPIWINGNTLNVTAYTNKKFGSKDAKKKAHEKLHKIILQAFPRYEVDVKIKHK